LGDKWLHDPPSRVDEPATNKMRKRKKREKENQINTTAKMMEIMDSDLFFSHQTVHFFILLPFR
jgi:hypothetical protein